MASMAQWSSGPAASNDDALIFLVGGLASWRIMGENLPSQANCSSCINVGQRQLVPVKNE